MSIRSFFGKKYREYYYEEDMVVEPKKEEKMSHEESCNEETWYAKGKRKEELDKVEESKLDEVSGGTYKHEDTKAKSYYDSNKQSSFLTPKYMRREKKNIITFVLENTAKVREHKDEILRIIKKIVGDNHSSLFLFLQSGSNKKFFDVMDFETFNNDKILESLFSSDNPDDEKVDLEEVLKHLNTFLDSQKTSFGVLEYKEKKYDVENNSIIFIGTAAYDEKINSKKEIVELMSSIKAKRSVKTIKYFCMEDRETINAAMLGFPVIGHIVADFYK